ncbi:cadmium-induced protein AS8 isoform X2 [Impatiens glandulifera]|nr:cadmium-induced protein AS8 isoform X2 [Impatiens glandulifera]
MIIKGLCGRYERWNPVHPTSGAFWGMGIGIGCGVGWGPGFGPDVIGYVGAGCGVGFSVGLTLAGFGIGLPASYVYGIPHNVFKLTRRGAIELGGYKGIDEKVPNFRHFEKGVNVLDLKEAVTSQTKYILDALRNLGAGFSKSS